MNRANKAVHLPGKAVEMLGQPAVAACGAVVVTVVNRANKMVNLSRTAVEMLDPPAAAAHGAAAVNILKAGGIVTAIPDDAVATMSADDARDYVMAAAGAAGHKCFRLPSSVFA